MNMLLGRTSVPQYCKNDHCIILNKMELPLTVRELLTRWAPCWLMASHWKWAESSSWAEESVKESAEGAESVLCNSTPSLFSTNVGLGVPSERQVTVTC